MSHLARVLNSQLTDWVYQKSPPFMAPVYLPKKPSRKVSTLVPTGDLKPSVTACTCYGYTRVRQKNQLWVDLGVICCAF